MFNRDVELGETVVARAVTIVRSLELKDVPDIEALLPQVADGAREHVIAISTLYPLVVLAMWDPLYLDEIFHWCSVGRT